MFIITLFNDVCYTLFPNLPVFGTNFKCKLDLQTITQLRG